MTRGQKCRLPPSNEIPASRTAPTDKPRSHINAANRRIPKTRGQKCRIPPSNEIPASRTAPTDKPRSHINAANRRIESPSIFAKCLDTEVFHGSVGGDTEVFHGPLGGDMVVFHGSVGGGA
ncbi:hypothetical protein CKA32_004946 [Geitlerinema sp. FC II]|nr:hypothetical protein CKA32_004946 [Geitlerinema sp. FC II]